MSIDSSQASAAFAQGLRHARDFRRETSGSSGATGSEPGAGAPIVVIGAGVAGLTAAVRLAEAGRRVLVLEARPRLGGRATAFEDKVTGARVDNGQHVLFGCYHDTLDLLRTIGAEKNVRIQPTLDVPFIDLRGRRTRLHCPDLPSPLHLLGGLLDWEALRWRDRWAAARVWRAVRRVQGSAAYALRATAPKGFRVQEEPRSPQPAVEGATRSFGLEPSAAFGLDPNVSVRDWLVALGQTRRLRDLLWEPLAVAALNEPAEIASAREFAQVLALMFTGGPQSSAIVTPRVPLDLMYAEPARAFIEARGGTVRVNAVARVLTNDTGVTGVRVGGETIPCRTAISTVPWNTFATLFDTMPAPLRDVADAAAQVVSRPIVTANLWYDRLVMDDDFVGLPNATIQWVFEKGSTASHLSCIVSGAIELVDRSNEQIIAIARADVESRLPRARRASFVRGAVVRERHATFSTRLRRADLDAASSGQAASSERHQQMSPSTAVGPSLRRPSSITRLGGLFLAGDWIDTGLPGTIEGAARSGRLAAEAIIQKKKEEK